VAVLERQPHAVVPFDGAAHRVAGHDPQQLPAGGLVGGGPGVGEVGALACNSLIRPVITARRTAVK